MRASNAALLHFCLPWAKVVRIPDPLPVVPACRDPFDTPLLHFAVMGKAQALVSGDRDLLALAGAPGLCTVLRMQAICEQMLAG